MPLRPSNRMANAPPPQPDPPYHNHYRTPSSHPLQHPPTPAFSLTDSDVALLSQSYSDFFNPLRSNTFACQWIFQWLFNNTPIDTSTFNLSLSRGFRSVYMCASRGCASIDTQTLLQKSSTLLLPVQSRDSVVFGYYVESASDQAAPESVRMGSYVYNSQTRALFKVAKVRGPPSASGLFSLCINRTNIVGTGMFIKDFVLISFPWQTDLATVPSQCIVHSRTLAFHKLSQTAQQAGLAGHSSHPDVVGNQDVGVTESSLYGLGTFGVYESVLVPSRLCSGMRAEGAEPSLSIGTWAVPEHYAFCRGHRFLHMGIFREEMTTLRSQFLQACSQPSPHAQPNPITNRFSADPSTTFDDNAQASQARAHQHSQTIQHEREQRSSQPIIAYPQQTVGYDNRVATDFEDSTVPVHSTTSVTTPIPLNPPRHGTVLVDAASNREITVDNVASSLPSEIPTSVMLPMHRLATGGQPYHPVGHTLPEVPSAVVDSIEAVVSAQRQPIGEKRGTVTASVVTRSVGMSPVATSSVPGPGHTAPIVTTSFPAPVVSKPTGVENKPPPKKEQTFSMQAFKKTLPAPTKSEIVIRNRISAQRSNEKRRRKIEATRTELAYLKTTYLPQLENRRGCLISENQSLKLKFMEKYHENDIESFF